MRPDLLCLPHLVAGNRLFPRSLRASHLARRASLISSISNADSITKKDLFAPRFRPKSKIYGFLRIIHYRSCRKIQPAQQIYDIRYGCPWFEMESEIRAKRLVINSPNG
jgi:hypothetical protein